MYFLYAYILKIKKATYRKMIYERFFNFQEQKCHGKYTFFSKTLNSLQTFKRKVKSFLIENLETVPTYYCCEKKHYDIFYVLLL